jgi:hypothetical protein
MPRADLEPQDVVVTPATSPPHLQSELVAALMDAEAEMHAIGSDLAVPGTLRLRLLDAARRAQTLIDAVEAPTGP